MGTLYQEGFVLGDFVRAVHPTYMYKQTSKQTCNKGITQINEIVNNHTSLADSR